MRSIDETEHIGTAKTAAGEAPDGGEDVSAWIRAQAQARREDLVRLCAELVAARSVNPDGDTRAAAEVVRGFLASRGLNPRLERQLEHMPSVLAELDSGQPGPHLVLNVHLDTMPPGDESTWSVPVWDMIRRDGRLYGLGMGNMKGAVAAMLHAVDLLAQLRHHWSGRITFTAVSDEVVFGDNGAAFLLRQHPGLTGNALLCGEGPGYRRLAVGEKGVLWLEVAATGEAGHSSAVRQGRSAAARIARAATAIDGLTGLRGTLPPELQGLAGAGLELTANVGVLAAGSFIGQIATSGRLEVDLRLPPGITADAAEDLVRAAIGGDGLTLRRIKGWDANVTDPGDSLVQAWRRGEVLAGLPAADLAIRLPASDASRWRQRGIPALCYGPQPTLSAGIDDYAVEDEVVNCAALYALAALSYLQGNPPQRPSIPAPPLIGDLP
ncbi:M20/M25/M40 family metallo-hydrolase [Arthrobacter sp. 35W]|uniref:M20/M25/M40 family metallo-hydrolase n=1 Tax=Arthrobacter sp. 35W TaxID=1132441 RepID=UPI0004024137|nr:M20/M25/M40 family metallo-hydrolase [Arthrobacter sp. 35W]